jgi:hypothetical protein
MIRSVTLLIALGLGLTGCATAGDGRSSRDTAVITAEEISATDATNAYDLVQRLRPRWLQTRGQQGLQTATGTTATGPVTGMQMTGVVVYLDGSPLGAVEALRQVSTRDLARLQRLSAADATQRFGTGHPHGAIIVTTGQR